MPPTMAIWFIQSYLANYLKVVDSHIELDQSLAFVGQEICCDFLDSCSCVDVMRIICPIHERLAIKKDLALKKIDWREVGRVNCHIVYSVDVRFKKYFIVVEVVVVIMEHKLKLRVGFVKSCHFVVGRAHTFYLAHTWGQSYLQVGEFAWKKNSREWSAFNWQLFEAHHGHWPAFGRHVVSCGLLAILQGDWARIFYLFTINPLLCFVAQTKSANSLINRLLETHCKREPISKRIKRVIFDVKVL